MIISQNNISTILSYNYWSSEHLFYVKVLSLNTCATH